LVLYLILTTAAVSAFAQQGQDSSHITFIKAGRLIDARDGKVLQSQGILIQGDRIKEVGPVESLLPNLPKEATVIDLTDATLLPGLIDCHTHITVQPEEYYEDLFRKSPINFAIIAHLYAQRTLEAGFTTVRDLGAPEFVDVALRDAINAGKIAGPRMQVATLGAGATGGHNDITGFSPYLKFGNFQGLPTAKRRSANLFDLK